jgi:hypothetical protein
MSLAACFTGTARLEHAPKQLAKPLQRFKHLHENGANNALWWYPDYPENVVGEARPASEDKGGVVLDIYARSVARAIKAVKVDTEAPRLQAEFFQRVQSKGVL